MAVDDGPETQSRRRRQYPLRRHRPQFGERRRACLAHEFNAGALGIVERYRRTARRREEGAALADRAMEQAARQRRRHQGADRLGARGLAGDGDLAGIAAERRDVALHPLQRGHQVEHAVIAGGVNRRLRRQFRMRQESKRIEPMIERDDDDALCRQIGPVIAGLGARTDDKAAAVDPHHDRHWRCGFQRRRPDVEVQAILARRLPDADRCRRTRRLASNSARTCPPCERRSRAQQAAAAAT